jgi:hypothetical protein
MFLIYLFYLTIPRSKKKQVVQVWSCCPGKSKKMVGIIVDATNCPEMVQVSYWGEREMATTRPSTSAEGGGSLGVGTSGRERIGLINYWSALASTLRVNKNNFSSKQSRRLKFNIKAYLNPTKINRKENFFYVNMANI